MTGDDLIVRKTLTNERLTKEIEVLVGKYKLDYIDAIVHFCEKNEIEIESVAGLLKNNSRISSQIQIEAEALNFLPKRSRLPI